MNCRKYRFLIEEYLDGLLPESQTASVTSHIELCPECKKFYDQRSKIFLALAETKNENWSIDLTASVMKSIEQLPVPAEPSIYRIPVIIAITTGLAVFLTVILLGLGSDVTRIPMLEIVKSMSDSLDLPPEFYASLAELAALIKGIWIGIKALSGLLTHIVFEVLIARPYISIPLLAIAATTIVVIWKTRMRAKRRLV